MLPRMPGTTLLSVIVTNKMRLHIRRTTRLGIPFTETAFMRALVISFAAVVALMKPTANAEQMAFYTLCGTELDICLHLNDHVVKSSA